MTVHKGPTTSNYTAFAQSYGDVCVAMREDGKLDFFLRSSGASIADAVELGSGNTKYLGYSACKDTTFMYFLGSDHKIYKTNSLASPTATTLFWDDKFVKTFAISSTTAGKGYVIDENDDLWQLDIQNINGPTAQVTSYQQVNPGTHYKQVASSYQGTTAAITTDNRLELIYIEGATYYTTDLETLPSDFNIAEVGFGYSTSLFDQETVVSWSAVVAAHKKVATQKARSRLV